MASIRFTSQSKQISIKNLNDIDIEDMVLDPSVLQNMNKLSNAPTVSNGITIHVKSKIEHSSTIWKEQDCNELHAVLGTGGMYCIPTQLEQDNCLKIREEALCADLFK